MDLYYDAIKTPKPKTKELALATLKNCQADCELYELGAKKQEAKKLFEEASFELKEVIQELEPIIKNKTGMMAASMAADWMVKIRYYLHQ